MRRSDNKLATEPGMIPPKNEDLDNVELDSDAVKTIDLSGLDFVPMVAEIRSDIDFQWSTGADPVSGTGPWIDAGASRHIPVNGAAAIKVRKRIAGGSNGTVFTKALGAL